MLSEMRYNYKISDRFHHELNKNLHNSEGNQICDPIDDKKIKDIVSLFMANLDNQENFNCSLNTHYSNNYQTDEVNKIVEIADSYFKKLENVNETFHHLCQGYAGSTGTQKLLDCYFSGMISDSHYRKLISEERIDLYTESDMLWPRGISIKKVIGMEEALPSSEQVRTKIVSPQKVMAQSAKKLRRMRRLEIV
jgi:hypothetical protein